MAALASLHRWRRQLLRVWDPVDAIAGVVLCSLMAGSCWMWWQVGKFVVGMIVG